MRSIQNILQHIDELVVRHTVYLNVQDKLLSAIQNGKRGRIIIIVGPTGVGKTSLALDTREILKEHVDKHPECGYSYPLYLEAESPEYGEFTWRSFYTQGLIKMGEFCLKTKRSIESMIDDLKLGKPLTAYQSLKVHELRTLFLEAIDELKPISVLIDEAASFGASKSHKNKDSNLNVIKSLSNRRSTIYTLFGTVDAQTMLNKSSQISRRVEPMPFWNYTLGPNDVKYFTKIMMAVLSEVGIPFESDLFNDQRYFYSHSIGLTGVAIEWIRRAVEEMHKSSSNLLTKSHFTATRLLNDQLETMANEIWIFQAQYSKVKDFNIYSYFNVKNAETEKTPIKITPNKHQPGRRNPTRDPVNGR